MTWTGTLALNASPRIASSCGRTVAIAASASAWVTAAGRGAGASGGGAVCAAAKRARAATTNRWIIAFSSSVEVVKRVRGPRRSKRVGDREDVDDLLKDRPRDR